MAFLKTSPVPHGHVSPFQLLTIAAAECWKDIIDSTEDSAEILITNSEKIQGWDNHDVHQVSSVDIETGTLYLTIPVQGNPVTTDINEMYAAEVALLNRRIIFDSITDGTDNLHGGHLIINRTPNVAQKLEGVELRNFGQQGIVGRYVSSSVVIMPFVL